MKWWGWGDPDHQAALPESALAALRSELGAPDRHVPLPSLDDLRLPDSTLKKKARARLVDAGRGRLGEGRPAHRVTHAAGKSYPDLVRMRSGSIEHAPDAVVYPADAGEVRMILEACADEDVAVVPFGGGTSVVGGVEPLRDGREAVITLDLGRIGQRGWCRQALADGDAGRGPARPGGRAALAAPRPHARPLPPVVGVRDRRRMGRDALGRPGLDRVRRDRQARQRAAVHRAGGRVRPAPRFPRPPRVPGCASSWSARRGLLGVITEATLKVRPQPEAQRLRGMDVPRLRGGRRGVQGARAGPRRPRCRTPVRSRTRRACR